MEALGIKAFAEAFPALGPFLGSMFALALLQIVVIPRIADRPTRTWILRITAGIQCLAALALIIMGFIER